MALYPKLSRQQSSESVRRKGKTHRWQISSHTDTETIPALTKLLEDRIKRHKQQYTDLKKQEEAFYAALCSFATEKECLARRNQELEKDLQAQKILSSRQNDHVDELEQQLKCAREILTQVGRHLDSRHGQERLCHDIAQFLRHARASKAKRYNSKEQVVRSCKSNVDDVPVSKRFRLPNREAGFSPTPSAPLASSTSSSDRITDSAQDFRYDFSSRSPFSKTSRSRQEDAESPAAFNHRHQGRRSKSADKRTVVHIHKNHTPVGTVLKPDVPKSSIVTAPPSPRKLKNSSKFLLINQETDQNAEIETQLWHGKVIPTAGQPSGSAVIFESIEKHHQVDAVSRKQRYNEENFRPREHSVSREEVQSRCAVSFSHKSPAKKSPSKTYLTKD